MSTLKLFASLLGAVLLIILAAVAWHYNPTLPANAQACVALLLMAAAMAWLIFVCNALATDLIDEYELELDRYNRLYSRHHARKLSQIQRISGSKP